jgi:hypothetical protein
MRGYQELIAKEKQGVRLNRVLMYVDAIPYRVQNNVTVKSFPTGVILADQTDDPAKLSFHAFRGVPVHITGGNMERVKQFADRVWQFGASVIVLDDGVEMEILREKK